MVDENENEKILSLKDFSKRVEHSLNKFKAITGILNDDAKEKGIVIVTALNNKVMFFGAVEQELQLPEFNTKFKLDFDGTVLDDSEEDFAEELICNRYEFNWACYFKLTNIKYEIFNDYGHENKEKWCQGICFYIEDLRKTTSGGRVMLLSEVDKLLVSNFKIASGAVQIKEGGAHHNFDFVLFENNGIGVLFKNRLFTIPFEELAEQAVDARLFGETIDD